MRKRLRWIIPVAVLALLAGGFAIYVGQYYRAGDAAADALRSDEAVQVSATDYGWWFDGPSDECALIFYPGGKVEAEAYAPLLHRLAAAGVDGCLVEMPFQLAILGIDRADAVLTAHEYGRWYIGGHSLGGACATAYAAGHGDALSGVILLGAYPMKPLGDDLDTVFIYGSEDGVLNRENYQKSRRLAPEDAVEYVIEGGNHAQFGDYGPQRGDGAASISPEAQIHETVECIIENIRHN